MIVTRKAIHRRTVLRGLGVSLALPLLDGMVPAFAALRKTPANAPRRFGVVYVPNGIAMSQWTPATEGAGFELTRILQPLEQYRERMLVLSGMYGPPPNGGFHANASTRFLTGLSAMPSEYELQAGVSIDQHIARDLGRQTQLASLEVGLDSRDVSGSCDVGFACAYSNTISWRTPTTPLPMENNPRALFERLFGDSGSTDADIRLRRIDEQRSILDSVTETVADLSRELGSNDRTRINEYLDAVRDIERRIQRAEEQGVEALPVVDQPAGVPASYDEHARLMFDLQVLAYQTDLTRVGTMMMGRELSGRTYTEIGVPDSHHPCSHHRHDPVLYEKLAKINTYHVGLFAYYLDKLRSTPDGDGSLLDHMVILYGAGMSDSNAHARTDLPLLLVGGGGDQVKGGRHLVYKDTPMANLNLALLEMFGVPREKLGVSTGALDVEPLSLV